MEYQIAITDASVIGKEIENEVLVRADNADEVRDREIVTVEEPETPMEPEEPEEVPKEVPKEEEPGIEEPEAEPAPKPAVKAEAVKTGDGENLMVLILLLILSCTAITACGKIARKTK